MKRIETEGIYELRDLPKGEFFKLIRKGKPTETIYEKNYWCLAERAYWVNKFYDYNDGRFMKPTTKVYAGFEF